MRKAAFEEMLKQVEELTPSQRKRLRKRLEAREGTPMAVRLAEGANGDEAACPHCAAPAARRWGNANGLHRWRCRACGRTFNALTGTALAHLHKKECWEEFASCVGETLTVRASAERSGVHRTTAFRWRHRFLQDPAELQSDHLQGIVEADETFFLESKKGSRHLGRKPRKRGGVAKQRGRSSEQVCVLVAMDRGGAELDRVMPGLNADTIAETLEPALAKDAVLCTDGLNSYKAYARKAGVEHKPLNLSAGIRVVEGVFHIQHVNAYHHRLKAWMAGFHGVSTRYLKNYLGWGGSSKPTQGDWTPKTSSSQPSVKSTINSIR